MNKNKTGISIFLLVTFIIALAGWFDLFNMMGTYHLFSSIKWIVMIGAGSILTALPLLLVIFYWIPATEEKISQFVAALQDVKLPEAVRFVIVFVVSISYSMIILSAYGLFFEGLYLRLFFIWYIAVISTIVIGKRGKTNFLVRLAFGLMAVGFFYIILKMYQNLSDSVFTLNWSEASRYYYASLFASAKLYGERFAWPFLHPSRYLLQSIPFFVGDFSLLAHRIWQVVLWILLPLITILVFQKRIICIKGYKAWVFIVWSFIFLFQGPVYYHLLVCVWLVFLGYDREKIWKTTLFVVLGSMWAGISRVNWFPVPAMIAIILYLLDHPFPGKQKLIKYFIPPAVFTVLGLLSALGSQLLYAVLSGEERVEAFGSSFTSDLLWYRLFPNSTSELGVIIPVLVLTIPVLYLLFKNMHNQKYTFFQYGPIYAIMAIMFLGGLVVSTKIGGGGNLHNLDAWLVIIWLLIGKLVFENAHRTNVPKNSVWKPSWILLIIFIIPFIYHIDLNRTYKSLIPVPVDEEMEQEELESILNRARNASEDGGEVLFVSQRQLLMFEGQDIPFTPDYELLTLMEMAISNNEPYLEHFYADLESHRFDVIVIEKQVVKIVDENNGYFSEENNAWVEKITIPLLENYEEVRYYPYSHVTILEPKP